MKDLSNLTPAENSHSSRKRLGRGIGSGLGKTSGKGHKGQKARKGGGVAPGFEGGQTPLYRRLPKYGFKNHTRSAKYHVVNLNELSRFEDGDVVSLENLVKKGVIRKAMYPVKILANGDVSKKLTFKVAKISAGAKTKVEAKGGLVEEK